MILDIELTLCGREKQTLKPYATWPITWSANFVSRIQFAFVKSGHDANTRILIFAGLWKRRVTFRRLIRVFPGMSVAGDGQLNKYYIEVLLIRKSHVLKPHALYLPKRFRSNQRRGG